MNKGAVASQIDGGGIVVGILKSVKPLENFILEAEFTDGTVKQYDVKPLFDEIPEFSEMAGNPELFQKAEVICCGYAVAWNDVLDLASEEIWDNGMTV